MEGGDVRAPAALAAAAIAVGLALRLYPALHTGMPLDNDSWYIHHDIEVLRAHPAAHVYSHSGFDGYNNYWPGGILEALIYTMVTGPGGLLATHLTGPLLEGLALIVFYALSRRILGPQTAWAPLLLLATAPSMIGLGAGLVKEALARPLLYAVILTAEAGLAGAALVASASLALYHHLSSAAALLALTAAYTLALALRVHVARGYRAPSPLSYLALLAATTAYLALVPYPGIRSMVLSMDLVKASLYVFLMISLAVAGASLIGERPGPLSLALPTAATLALAAAIAARGLPPAVQEAGWPFLLYAAPLLVAPPLAAAAMSRLRSGEARDPLPVAWALSLTGVALYIVVGGAPLGQSPAGRVENLAIPGFLLAYGQSRSRLLKPVAAAMVVVAIAYTGVMLHGLDPESFDLPYHKYEDLAAGLVASLDGGHRVYGDSKMRDILYYHGVHASRPYPEWGRGILLVYKENLAYGYKLDSNLHAGDPAVIAGELRAESLLAAIGGCWMVYKP